MKKSTLIGFALGVGVGALCYKYKDEISDAIYAVECAASDALRPIIDAVVAGECPFSCPCCHEVPMDDDFEGVQEVSLSEDEVPDTVEEDADTPLDEVDA